MKNREHTDLRAELFAAVYDSGHDGDLEEWRKQLETGDVHFDHALDSGLRLKERRQHHDSGERSDRSPVAPSEYEFALVEDPHRLYGDRADARDASDRLRVLAWLGGRLIRVAHSSNADSPSLRLVAFCSDGNDRAVPLSEVSGFFDMCDQQGGLYSGEAERQSLSRHRSRLELDPNGRVVTDPLTPALESRRFGVVLHFVTRWNDWEVKGFQSDSNPFLPGEGDGSNPDPLFASFEQDLLSYAYVPGRGESPLQSHVIKVGPRYETVELTIKSPIKYMAEGQSNELHLPGPLSVDHAGDRLRRHKIAVRASRTDFRKSKSSVFHLAFVNDPSQAEFGLDNDPLDEFALVALSKLWQQGEERWEAGMMSDNPAEAIKIRLQTDQGDEVGSPLSIEKFAEKVFSVDGVKLRKSRPSSLVKLDPFTRNRNRKNEFDEIDADPWQVRVGTIQLITCNPGPGENWEAIWKSASASTAGPSEARADGLNGATPPAAGEQADDREVARSEADLTRQAAVERQVVALAGVVQGLLDFEAIDQAEIEDVFDPYEIIDDLVGIHKGTLLRVIEKDRTFDKASSAIGVSPYLLIPQAVLLHNEAVLDEVGKVMRMRPKGEKAPWKLKSDFTTMDDHLATYVPNVFHYRAEQELFEIGEQTRGLSERRQALMRKARAIETRWMLEVEKRRSLAETIRNFLLGSIAVIATFEYVHDHLQRWLIFGLSVLVGFALTWMAFPGLFKYSLIAVGRWAKRVGRNGWRRSATTRQGDSTW